MSYVSSLLEILRATLKRLESAPEFSAADAHARELRRWLLIAIADLEDRMDDEDIQLPPDTFVLAENAAAAWNKLEPALPLPAKAHPPSPGAPPSAGAAGQGGGIAR